MPQLLRRVRLVNALLFCGTVAASAGLSLLTPALSPAVQASLQDSPKAVLDEAWQIVYRDYVDGNFNNVDWVAIRQELLSRNYSTRDQAYTTLRQALQRLQDPYTRFMNPQQFQALTNQTSGELSGVGIRMKADEESGEISIVEPIQNSPAAAAGIQAGDRILSIDGESTSGMSLEDASQRIRGEEGSSIVLEIQREESAPFDVTLTRSRIQLSNVHHTLKQENGARVGYVRLSEFSANSAEQMQGAINSLLEQNAEGFVLDLRGNPGGLLDASIAIARMWLPSGTIVRTEDRTGGSYEYRANNTALTTLPLVVLVDGNSASSSEILTGALKDNNRATVVGSTTFGKALVQSVHRLSDGSGLAVTVSHYYTPNGTDISQLGITPDIQVSLNESQQRQLTTNPQERATATDVQYVRALSALQSTISAQPRQPRQAAEPNQPRQDTRLSLPLQMN
ncbi:MAG: S41 family peptidase [Kaiparowitsia implicata GSE-PSE-MK54-09C]|nr:S41 family peptidase [Kaiparowitsia implicata GSE-PSE-MK54-09C]